MNILDPANPLLVGNYLVSGGAYRIEVAGNTAYLGVSSGLRMIDVSDPRNPVKTGGYLGNTPLAIKVTTNRLYVAEPSPGRLRIFDNPSPGGLTEAGSLILPMSFPEAIEVIGNLAYVGGQGSPSMLVVDVSNSPAPKPVGAYSSSSSIQALRVVGDQIYAGTESGLEVLDNQPVQWGLTTYPAWGGVKDIRVVDGLAYLAEGISQLQIFDVRQTGPPVFRGGYMAGRI